MKRLSFHKVEALAKELHDVATKAALPSARAGGYCDKDSEGIPWEVTYPFNRAAFRAVARHMLRRGK